MIIWVKLSLPQNGVLEYNVITGHDEKAKEIWGVRKLWEERYKYM